MNKTWKLLVLVAVFALMAAACGSKSSSTTAAAADDGGSATTVAAAADDGGSATTMAATETTAAAADSGQGSDLVTAGKHVCIIGGNDPFWVLVKNGADLAGEVVEKTGNEYTWFGLANYDSIGPDTAKLIEQAVAQNCTSLSVPVWDGDAETPAIKNAVDAGLKVFIYNSGLPLLEDGTVPALGYFGTDEYKAGVAAGKYFVEHGSKDVRCVNTLPGAVNWQQRCGGLIDGATEAGGRGEEIILPAEAFGDAAQVSAAVQAALAEDPTIDGFATGDAADADAIGEALSVSGATAQQGGWDISENIIDRIAKGETLFAVDQQGWYQGWLAVSQAWLYDQFAILPATNIILTGPALITADNVETVQGGIRDGFR